MSPLLIATLCLTMVATSFLSGIFGMAGGMILIGVLLALLPLPEAMVLHGVTQMASNGWRGRCGGGMRTGARSGAYAVGALLASCCCGRSGATCRASRSPCFCSG